MYDSNGNKIDGNEVVKRHIVQHFRNLYIDRDETDPTSQAELLLVIPSKISEDENEELMKPILEHEISDTIWSL